MYSLADPDILQPTCKALVPNEGFTTREVYLNWLPLSMLLVYL